VRARVRSELELPGRSSGVRGRRRVQQLVRGRRPRGRLAREHEALRQDRQRQHHAGGRRQQEQRQQRVTESRSASNAGEPLRADRWHCWGGCSLPEGSRPLVAAAAQPERSRRDSRLPERRQQPQASCWRSTAATQSLCRPLCQTLRPATDMCAAMCCLVLPCEWSFLWWKPDVLYVLCGCRTDGGLYVVLQQPLCCGANGNNAMA